MKLCAVSSSSLDRLLIKELLKELLPQSEFSVVSYDELPSSKSCAWIFFVRDKKELLEVFHKLKSLIASASTLIVSRVPCKEVENMASLLGILSVRCVERTDSKSLPKNEVISFVEEQMNIAPSEERKREKYILIGASTGGPALIEEIVSSLPSDYPYPICVVQHMPENFTSKFAERLNQVSPLEIIEAKDGLELIPGRVIIGKGGYHLKFGKFGNKVFVRLVPNVSNKFFCPSVDEMFFSAAEVLEPEKIVAVLLTGIGDDGADGMVLLKKKGAYTIAESEETAAIYGMPREAYLRGGVVKKLPFPEILKELRSL